MLATATLIVASLLVGLAAAIPWAGPVPTPAGFMAMAGMSPRPTEAPGLNGIPQELRKRGVIYPPPDNWCGFVAGDYSNVLSCKPQYTCAQAGAAIGCCPDTTGACDAFYTTCYNYAVTYSAAYVLDTSILKCSDPLTPYCGTYAFRSGYQLYNCQTFRMAAASVEFLNDYYVTAISSTLDSSLGFSSSLVSGSSMSSPSPTSSISFSTPTPISYTTPTTNSFSSSNTYTYHSSSSITAAAIGGIASGISLVVAVVAGLIVFFCLRRRRRMRVAQSQAAARANFPTQPQSPPVQQEQVYPKTAEGGSYQPVSQQDQPAPPPQYPVAQYGKPAPQYPASPTAFYNPPPAPAQARDTLSVNQDPRPFSTATSTLAPTNASEIDAHTGADYYNKTPVSPTITEADGRTVSPLHTGGPPTPAPAPPSTGTGPVYEAPPSGGNGPVYDAPPPAGGYEAPPPSSSGHGPVYEVGNNQPYQGPWEMGHHQ